MIAPTPAISGLSVDTSGDRHANYADARWERIFAEQRYETHFPFEIVIRFVFRHAPKTIARSNIKILEIGCGLGNNLRFVAGAGFDAYGIDVSPTAVARASALLAEAGLSAKIVEARAGALPYESDYFDMVIDRGALTCMPDPEFQAALAEAKRVLKPGGSFLFTPFADTHSSNGIANPIIEGMTDAISSGSLFGNDRAIRFVSFNELRECFRFGWKWKALQLVETTEVLEANRAVNASWHAILEKA